MSKLNNGDFDELIRQRQKNAARAKNQLPFAAVLLAVIAVAALYLAKSDRLYPVFLIIGMLFGMVLRYSRICFAAAFRDPFLIKNTKMLQALLLALIVSSIGFAVIQYRYLGANPGASLTDIPGMLEPVGLHTALGAFIFGIGMVFAGECASTVLVRIGEGHILPVVTLLGLFVGTALGAHDYAFWYDRLIKNTVIIYFPKYLNIGAALIIQVAVLVLLNRLAAWYQKKHSVRH
ncbi:MAG: YeeE/YedE thiosulfate transporter family protein [Oscillospiraceae bacterium]|nr:YeeE/YedE thiosulfate transporter family protein [Oscillospiraceae bacterium]